MQRSRVRLPSAPLENKGFVMTPASTACEDAARNAMLELRFPSISLAEEYWLSCGYQAYNAQLAGPTKPPIYGVVTALLGATAPPTATLYRSHIC